MKEQSLMSAASGHQGDKDGQHSLGKVLIERLELHPGNWKQLSAHIGNG